MMHRHGCHADIARLLIHVALLPTALDQVVQTLLLSTGLIVPLLLLRAAGRRAARSERIPARHEAGG